MVLCKYNVKQEEKSLGSLLHLSILILSEKHLSLLVKLTVLAVVCPPPTKYLAVVAFGFGGHLYPYSLQTASEAVNKQLTISKILNFHSKHLCLRHL